MTEQFVEKFEPDKDRSDSLPGFCVQPVWMTPPVQPVPSFDIRKPVFYMINGQPMAFAGEVSHATT